MLTSYNSCKISWRKGKTSPSRKKGFFWGGRSMFNRFCDRLDKKQPDSWRGWIRVQPRFEPLTTKIHHHAETQSIASQPFVPVSVSGLNPSLSTVSAPCWHRKCPFQAMVTQTVREHPHELGSQMLGLQDPAMDLMGYLGFNIRWEERQNRFSFLYSKGIYNFLVSNA